MKLGFSILIMCLCLTFNVQAQIQVLSRAELENVENPSLSEDASNLKFKVESIVADEMTEDGGIKSFTYTFKNVGTDTVHINRLVTSCSCAVASYNLKSVAPGKEGEITVKYNPKGHPGRFERKIFVYTGGYKSPAAILRLKVNVEVGADISGTYQYPMGKLRFRRTEITFRRGEKAVENCACVNVSDAPVKVACNKYLLSSALKFTAQPEILQPGQEGTIVVEYDPSVVEDRNELLIMLNGLGVPPSQSVIKVKLK